jgi:prepilin-type processing-associated H-X9-DG protein
LICPSSNDTPAAIGPTTRATVANINAGGHLSYIYLAKGMTNTQKADTILVYEPLSNHQNNGMNVLFGDLHVDWIAAKEAKWMLSELKLGHNPPWNPATQPSATTK